MILGIGSGHTAWRAMGMPPMPMKAFRHTVEVCRGLLSGESVAYTARGRTRDIRFMDTESGYDESVWAQLCDELGLAAIAVPEHCGGAGFGFVEQGIVLEEMGRSLLCAPYFSSVVLAANAVEAVSRNRVNFTRPTRMPENSAPVALFPMA